MEIDSIKSRHDAGVNGPQTEADRGERRKAAQKSP